MTAPPRAVLARACELARSADWCDPQRRCGPIVATAAPGHGRPGGHRERVQRWTRSVARRRRRLISPVLLLEATESTPPDLTKRARACSDISGTPPRRALFSERHAAPAIASRFPVTWWDLDDEKNAPGRRRRGGAIPKVVRKNWPATRRAQRRVFVPRPSSTQTSLVTPRHTTAPPGPGLRAGLQKAPATHQASEIGTVKSRTAPTDRRVLRRTTPAGSVAGQPALTQPRSTPGRLSASGRR